MAGFLLVELRLSNINCRIVRKYLHLKLNQIFWKCQKKLNQFCILLLWMEIGKGFKWERQCTGWSAKGVGSQKNPNEIITTTTTKMTRETPEVRSDKRSSRVIRVIMVLSRVRQNCPKCTEFIIPGWILYQWPCGMPELTLVHILHSAHCAVHSTL